ncbi:MAG TPA: adenylate kinase [Bryobacteraceae bacterium]|nr:adenylate kinase [Bryobacteraceae bacterium]
MILLLFGPPGCGKGTQAALISEFYNIPAISTGEMFRAECKAGTPLGKKACSILSSGGLVGDDIVNQIVASRISKPDCSSGFLLDGYPRTVPQAEFLNHLLAERGLPQPTVIHLDVAGEVLVARISARRQCPTCGHIYNVLSQPPKVAETCDIDGATLTRREDDTEAVIRQRLEAYETLTGPVIEYYRRGACIRIDGKHTPQAIFEEIKSLLAPVPQWGKAPRAVQPELTHA